MTDKERQELFDRLDRIEHLLMRICNNTAKDGTVTFFLNNTLLPQARQVDSEF